MRKTQQQNNQPHAAHFKISSFPNVLRASGFEFVDWIWRREERS